MPKYNMTGRVAVLMDTQTFDSGFQKREFVIDSGNEKWPNLVKFGCLKKRIAELDGVQVGDDVDVEFVVDGREHNGKYYVDLVALNVGHVASAPGSGDATTCGEPIGGVVTDMATAEDAAIADDDCPF